MLRAAGASAALSLGAGGAVATTGTGPGPGGGGSNPNYVDPVFGKPSAGTSPCVGDGHGDHLDTRPDCLDDFRPPTRPSHEVELHTDLAPVLLAIAEASALSPTAIEQVNSAAEDGDVSEDLPDETVDLGPPFGEQSLTDVAEALVATAGFHFDPAGLHVLPGDVVLWDAESPDHAVAAYHERHGRQNRVPDGVGPIASPLIPAEGYWLYQFGAEGVYDLVCPTHQLFGMVMRVVVYDDEDGGEVPSVTDYPVESPELRPPAARNAMSMVLGGLDPNLPSSKAALETDALEPRNVVENGPIGWDEVVADHRS